MRCYICNTVLSSDEIEYERDHKKWAPCKECRETTSENIFEIYDTEDNNLETYIILNEQQKNIL